MIIIDVESTDVPGYPINIGAVDLEQPMRQIHLPVLVPEGTFLHPKAMEKNGHAADELRAPHRLPLGDAIRRFTAWYGRAQERTIAGMNPAGVDLPALHRGIAEAGIDLCVGYRTIDLHSVAVTHMLLNAHALPVKDGFRDVGTTTILKYTGLPEEPLPHRYGLTGAQYEAEAFSRLLYRRPLFREFLQYPLPAKCRPREHGELADMLQVENDLPAVRG